jgi:NhaP-type Na+/H+ or K+/H+ antiporter
MHETLWFLIVGAVLVFMGVAATTLRRLPVSAAMFYLAIGYALGPPGMDLLRLDMVADAHLLRIITEVALLVSLFAIGLRLRLGVFEKLWTVPLRLGFLAMLATIPLLTLFGVYALHLGWGHPCCSLRSSHRPIRCWPTTSRYTIPAITISCASHFPAKAA